MSEMPRGYRFNPTEEDLLYYLAEKVKGNQFPDAINGVIIEKDVYGGKAPWELFKDDDPWHKPVDALSRLRKQQCLYIITKLKKTMEKNARRVDCGVWRIAAEKEIVEFEGKHLGFMTKLKFHAAKNRRDVWAMYEYELPESDSGDLVLCRITRSESSDVEVQEVKETGCSGNNENVEELGKGKSFSEYENRIGVEILDQQKEGNDGLLQKQEGTKSVSGNLDDLWREKSVSVKENACEVPRGYRYCPTEEDLLYYVQLKVMKIPLPDAIKRVVIEKDVDICDQIVPWLLFNDNDPWRKPVDGYGMISKDKFLDVITKLFLQKDNKKEMAIVSPAGSGTWKHRNEKPIKNSIGEEIGTRTLFKFESEKGSVGNGIWSMYQYKFNVSDEFVICRMKMGAAKTMPESSKTGDQENIENIEDLKEGKSGAGQEQNPVGEEIHNGQQKGDEGVSKKSKKDQDFCPFVDELEDDC